MRPLRTRPSRLRVVEPVLKQTAPWRPAQGDDPLLLIVRRNLWGTKTEDPYLDYGRFLTPEGGVLFVYKDIDTKFRHTLWRAFAFAAATGLAAWALIHHSPVESGWIRLALLILAGVLNWFIVSKPVEIYRRIEIRPDCMILEDKDVFWFEKMDAGLPSFRPDQEGNRILCGIYGSRFVEYLTVRRFDDYDRMPEVFIVHLQEAMSQLWLPPHEGANPR
jgi:hypothetical protein